MKKREIDSILERLRDISHTQKDVEMCEILGISYGTLDNWKARDSIPPRRLKQIAVDNNISYEWLDSGIGAVKDVSLSYNDPEITMIVDALKDFSKEKRRRVLHFVLGLVDQGS